MVQGINSGNQTKYGTIEKIGATPDGRAVYKLVNGDGSVAGGISIPQKDCDTFEIGYNMMMSAAPKLDNYMKTHSEEDIKRQQKRGRRIIGGSTLAGGLIPALFSYKLTSNIWLQILMTVGGTVAGFFAGRGIGIKVMTPPGADELQKASKMLSNIDIQQV